MTSQKRLISHRKDKHLLTKKYSLKKCLNDVGIAVSWISWWFWYCRSVMKPEILHLIKVSRLYWFCWSMEHTLNIKELNFIVISLCKSWVISCLSVNVVIGFTAGHEKHLHDTKYLKSFHKWWWSKTWYWTRCLRNKKKNPKFHSHHILCAVLCFVSKAAVSKDSNLGHLFIELLPWYSTAYW